LRLSPKQAHAWNGYLQRRNPADMKLATNTLD